MPQGAEHVAASTAVPQGAEHAAASTSMPHGAEHASSAAHTAAQAATAKAQAAAHAASNATSSSIPHAVRQKVTNISVTSQTTHSGHWSSSTPFGGVHHHWVSRYSPHYYYDSDFGGYYDYVNVPHW